MKKLIIILILAFCGQAKAQTAFYQAQYLQTISPTQLDNILAQTGAASTVQLSAHERKTVEEFRTFLITPFAANLKSLDITALKSAITKYNAAIKVNLNTNSVIGKTHFTPLGGASAIAMISSLLGGGNAVSPEQQTKIIDAITKFYAEEFKKAQLLSYMEVFKETIGKKGELEVLFPQTYRKLQSVDPSKFPDLGDEFKEIFNADLKNIAVNLKNHVNTFPANTSTPTADETAKNERFSLLNIANNTKIRNNEFYQSFLLTDDLGSKLINNYHPVDLFNYIDEKYYDASLLSANPKTVSNGVKLILHGLNLVQRNLVDSAKVKDTKTGNIWISLQELRSLDTPVEWIYFSALLYQQDPDFFKQYFFDPTSIQAIPIDANLLGNDQLQILKERISNILAAMEEVESFRANLKEENMKENFMSYMTLILKTIEKGNYVNNNILTGENMQKYQLIANYALNIYDNAREKDYSNSIYYTLQFLNEIVPGIKDDKVVKLLDKYAGFMSDAINTKNSDELKDMIRKNVAEPTSFILKRQYVSTFSVTGQPGYFLGTEKLKEGEAKGSFISGLTLPMGFEFTLRSKRAITNTAGSWGVFVQLVDLGAVLNFRTSDMTSTLPDKIEAKQLFSPGISLNHGFKNSPLTIGLGYQSTPELRKVSLAGGNELYSKGNRGFLRMAWDIPLINIWKSKD